MSNKTKLQTELKPVRLDRWLWASRFFKTRPLAKQAIEGGKIHLNGQRAKPAKVMSLGETLTIRRGYELYTVVVTGLSDKRGPSKIALQLYAETEESQALRSKEAELRRIAQMSVSTPDRKPDKRQRRQIHQFKKAQPN